MAHMKEYLLPALPPLPFRAFALIQVLHTHKKRIWALFLPCSFAGVRLETVPRCIINISVEPLFGSLNL